MTPSDDPKATRGASLEDDLERNSILQKKHRVLNYHTTDEC